MNRRALPIPHLPDTLPLDTGGCLTCGHQPLDHGMGICFGTLACRCTAYQAPPGDEGTMARDSGARE
jgi:hypothetical protein